MVPKIQEFADQGYRPYCRLNEVDIYIRQNGNHLDIAMQFEREIQCKTWIENGVSMTMPQFMKILQSRIDAVIEQGKTFEELYRHEVDEHSKRLIELESLKRTYKDAVSQIATLKGQLTAASNRNKQISERIGSTGELAESNISLRRKLEFSNQCHVAAMQTIERLQAELKEEREKVPKAEDPFHVLAHCPRCEYRDRRAARGTSVPTAARDGAVVHSEIVYHGDRFMAGEW